MRVNGIKFEKEQLLTGPMSRLSCVCNLCSDGCLIIVSMKVDCFFISKGMMKLQDQKGQGGGVPSAASLPAQSLFFVIMKSAWIHEGAVIWVVTLINVDRVHG